MHDVGQVPGGGALRLIFYKIHFIMQQLYCSYRALEQREGRLCVLMELCDGGCVAALLRNYGALRWNIVARSLRMIIIIKINMNNGNKFKK